MKSRGTRATQAGGGNISSPVVITTSQTFTPNAYPFKFKVYLLAGGSNGNHGYGNSTTNFYYERRGGGGGAGGLYISSSTETLTSGSLTFTVGAAPVTTAVTFGGSTNVVRNDNAVTYAAVNTNFSTSSNNGNSGSSGGGGGRVERTSNNTGSQTNYTGGYGGFHGGPGTSGNFSSGGSGTTNLYVSANAVTVDNRGNDTRIPSGGDGYSASATNNAEVVPAYSGINISGTTYLAGSNYGKGGAGSIYISLNDMTQNWSSNFSGGPGAAILEPIP